MPRRKDRRCDVSGCGRRHLARGWCQTHYLEWKATGQTPIKEIRFQSKRRR